MGGSGSSRGSRNWGDRGNWFAVRSRKRKATETAYRGWDSVRGSDGQRGAATGIGHVRFQVSDRVSKGNFRDRQATEARKDGGFSNNVGGRMGSSEWHASDVSMARSIQGLKVSFYITNFPNNLLLFRLRQSFEVCGILSDVYVA